MLHEGRLQAPFVYRMTREVDAKSRRKIYTEDRTTPYPVELFTRGERYRFWGLFDTDLHLFGVSDEATFFVFGRTDWGVICSPASSTAPGSRCRSAWSAWL